MWPWVTETIMTTNATHVPTKGQDAVEILTNDHDSIKTCLQQLCDATDASKRKQILNQLKGLFTIHNATEENIIYPALREIAGKKMESQHLVNETAEADLLMFQLDSMLRENDADKFQDTAEKLQSAVLDHINDEEQKAFPQLQDESTDAQYDNLTQCVQELRQDLRFTAGSSKTEKGEA